MFWFRKIPILALIVMLAAIPVLAQGPDGWTVYELNLRASPNGNVIGVIPVNTGMIFEARNADMSWLLGHTTDGVYRGWVASGYLAYAEGFAASRLPISDEVVAAGSAPPAPPAAGEAAPAPAESGVKPDGTIEAMTLIYESDHSEYYRLTYWSDGLRINGFIGYPKGPGPYPAIIYNRGGMWDSGALTGSELVAFVETGYVCAASQYRGNAGSEGVESFGYGDVIDVINLITLVQALPQADPWRIGMMGASRGGMVTYMVLKAEAESGRNRIRAAVTVGGVADLFMWVEDTPDMLDILTVLVGPPPDQAPDLYKVRSATYWPEWITVPLLLMHGENDWIVLPHQSQKLYDAMKAVGRDVTLIIYPGDDHALTGQLGGFPEAVRFFGRHFQTGTDFESRMDNINAALRGILGQ
jgi:dipeptidyl aminopeptidase/acylaminoacyl peptidase